MKVAFALLGAFCILHTLDAADFRLDKQKVKLSLEYESFVDSFGNEVITPGVKGTYLIKGKAALPGSSILNFEYQTGLKANLHTSFDSGELAPFQWSNRLNSSLTIPFGKFYTGGSFFLRNKWVSEIDRNQFIDVFGGLGYRDVQGSIFAGVFPAPDWELNVSLHASDVNFEEFRTSDSSGSGISFRVSRRFSGFKMNVDYRIQKTEYNRPVFVSIDGTSFFPVSSGSFIPQQDDFQAGGFLIEFLRPFYFSGGYSYQINDSNNPGFSYRNHKISFLIGTDLGSDFHLQAYGIAQRQNFEESGPLPLPVFLEDTDYDTVAVSLIRTLSESTEMEFGAQRLIHNSSFEELDASKFIVFAALNYRF